MDTLALLLLVTVFLFCFALVGVVYHLWGDSNFADKRTVRRRLLYISAGGKHGMDKLAGYRERVLREASPLERVFFTLPRISGLDRMLLKARVPMNTLVFLAVSLMLGGLGLAFGLRLLHQVGGALALALLGLALPFVLLKFAERSFLQRFNDQLPEALDFLARAVRSGHGVLAGMGMVAEEMADPIRTEFAATVDEINLGLTMHEALENLCERVASTDLRYFAVAVLVQKETGGNIAEIFDNLSRLIRERIQFARQVKALTAEGRLSAVVLLLLPVLMFAYMYLVNYEYVSLLWTEPIGRFLLAGAVMLQLAGALVIRKLVSIEI